MADRPLTQPGYVLLTDAEYRRLLVAAENDDTLIICETCGAWLDHMDPALAPINDYQGCWKVAAGREQDAHLCRSWRAPDRAPSMADLEPGANLVAPTTTPILTDTGERDDG